MYFYSFSFLSTSLHVSITLLGNLNTFQAYTFFFWNLRNKNSENTFLKRKFNPAPVWCHARSPGSLLLAHDISCRLLTAGTVDNRIFFLWNGRNSKLSRRSLEICHSNDSLLRSSLQKLKFWLSPKDIATWRHLSYPLQSIDWFCKDYISVRGKLSRMLFSQRARMSKMPMFL